MILTVTLNPAIDKVYQVDSFEVGDVFRPRDLWATAGGKGLNVSRVASILGAKVVATGFAGGGNGQYIRRGVKQQGIEDAFVEIEGETRICIAINDALGNTSTEILEPGPNISLQEQQRFLERFLAMVPDADIITISGSLPRGVPLEFYGRIIEISKKYSKRVLLDTSGSTLAKSIEYKPYMIKPNESELQAITQGDIQHQGDLLRAARKVHERGVELVCVTLGQDGCLAVSHQGAFRLKAPTIDTVNTVGSGDSFLAGCAVALEMNKPVEEALKLGMACGMANTQFRETGKVSRELVEEYLEVVSLEKLEG